MYWRDIFISSPNFYSIRGKNEAEEKSKYLKLTVKKEKEVNISLRGITILRGEARKTIQPSSKRGDKRVRVNNVERRELRNAVARGDRRTNGRTDKLISSVSGEAVTVVNGGGGVDETYGLGDKIISAK